MAIILLLMISCGGDILEVNGFPRRVSGVSLQFIIESQWIPLENQWSDYTPAHYTDFHKADESISTNHLDELGNNICSSILYERLKQIGWDKK